MIVYFQPAYVQPTLLLAIAIVDSYVRDFFPCGANFAELLANPLVELLMVLFSHLLD